MSRFCNWVRTGKPFSLIPTYAVTPDPSPDVMAKRPQLAPSVGTCFQTDDHLDAQNDWLAHIAAGRITIG